jgi:hypothetical protein
MARAREVKRIVCTQCEEQISKCSLCGYWFEDGDIIECVGDGLKHVCKDCI